MCLAGAVAIQRSIQNYDVNITVTIHIFYPPHVHRPDVDSTVASTNDTTSSRRLLMTAGKVPFTSASRLAHVPALFRGSDAASSSLLWSGVPRAKSTAKEAAAASLLATARQANFVVEQLLATLQARIYNLDIQPPQIQVLTGRVQDQLSPEPMNEGGSVWIDHAKQYRQLAEKVPCQTSKPVVADCSGIGQRVLGARQVCETGLGVKHVHPGRQLLQTTGLHTSLASLQDSMASGLGATSVSQQPQGQEVDVVAVRRYLLIAP